MSTMELLTIPGIDNSQRIRDYRRESMERSRSLLEEQRKAKATARAASMMKVVRSLKGR